MMNIRGLHTIALLSVLCVGVARGKTGVSTYKVPEGLVKGGAFIDRFQPVPLRGDLRDDVWGAENVIPRDVKNGIEDPAYSYWGGNIIVDQDGRNHMFVCRWAEDNVKGKSSGHSTWWNSTVVHAVSDDPLGPYKVVDVIGPGHNPEIYKNVDGDYVIGLLGPRAYRSSKLSGPWEEIETTFKWLDERKPQNKTNRTYIPRDDGSLLMMNKNGIMFVSEDGSENFKQVTEKTVYPVVKGAKFEDPVIWKDEVQYNAVFNDWYGRVAFYLRSPDGIHWKWAPGYAYDLTVMNHVGGTSEEWYKFERPKVRQDEFGRATHMNFAVIDTVKNADLANDSHSSKNIVIPLAVPRRIQLLDSPLRNKSESNIRIKLLAEDGFDPNTDINFESLRFGAPEAVNFGRGSRAISSERVGADMIITFDGKNHEISANNFTAKLLGTDSADELVFGYVQLP